MRFFLIFCFCSFFCINSSWAQLPFMNTYSIDNYGSIGIKVFEHDLNYSVWGHKWFLTGNWWMRHTGIITIDKLNALNFLEHNVFPFPDSSNAVAVQDVIRLENGGFIAVGQNFDTISNPERVDFCIMWFDNNFFLQRYKIWGYSRSDYPLKVLPLLNGDIILLGNTSSFSDWNYGQIYLARLDSLGNIIWDRFFGHFNRQESFLDMKIVNDVIFITGAFRNFDVSPIYIKSFAYKYDLSGNYIALKEFQNSPNRDYNLSYSAAFDGTNFFLSGTDANADSSFFNIIKFDTSLNLIWQKELSSLKQFNILAFRSLWDNERKQLLYTTGYYDDNARPLSGVIATDTTGNIRWMQQYYTRLDIDQYIYDIQKTNDGGYIMCGSAFPDSANASQDFWVIKTDSVGCIINCITAVDTEPQPTINADFRIFPNPSSGDFSISCENIDSEWVELDLFDYTGKRILNTGFYNSFSFGYGLKKGIYLAVVRSQQHTQSFKIIKQ